MTRENQSALLIFVDGLGIGTRGGHNPSHLLEKRNRESAAPLAVFEEEEPQIPFDGLLVRTDACLGVEGRPQSASGQTTILTGVNAPAALGYHKQGFPNEELRAIIREHSVFKRLEERGVAPNLFANAYTPRFFTTRPRWVSATTVACEAANMEFCTLEDLRNGEALFHDFTNESLLTPNERYQLTKDERRGIERRTPKEAAAILARLAATRRFTLYEFFLTDRIGHAQDMNAAMSLLPALAEFVRETVARVDLSRATIILTSDHGNIEDLSVKNHTKARVPTLAWGASKEIVASRVKSLVDIAPTIIEILCGS